MMYYFRFLLTTVILLIVQLSFAQTVLNAADFKQHTDTAAKKILLDVRTPEEFATGHITGALNVDFNNTNFNDNIALLDKTVPVYLYCKGGLRSAGAAKKLRELGFSKIYDLKGGIMAWTNNDFPVADAAVTTDTYTIGQFHALLKNTPKVFVDFYADWCLPCKKMEPGLQQIQESYKGKVTVVRINIDEAKALAKELGLDALPVLITYRNGKEIKRLTGYQTDDAMKKLITGL